MKPPRGRRGRRGLALAWAAAAAALFAVIASEWTRLQLREARRAEAEAVAADLASLAWAYDHWLHDWFWRTDGRGQRRAAEMLRGPGREASPRALSPAEQLAAAEGAPDGIAPPWRPAGGLRLSAEPSPPAGADWGLRYAVGWPSGRSAGDPGTGPPHGVVVARALTGRARRESVLVRNALNRRGSSAPPPDASGGALAAPPGDLAAEIARAAGIAVGAFDIAAPSWQFSGVGRDLALRRPRAGQPPPGMDGGMEFEPGVRLIVSWAVEAGSAAAAEIKGYAGASPMLEAGVLEAGGAEIEAGEIEALGSAEAAGTVSATGTIEAGDWTSSTGRLTGIGPAASRFRSISALGSAGAEDALAQSVSAAGPVFLTGHLGVEEDIAAADAAGAGLELQGDLEIGRLLFAPDLRLTGPVGVRITGPGPELGACRGCGT